MERKETHTTFSIRDATLYDLDRLVAFIMAEAREAEGIEKETQIIAQGIRAGLLNPQVARYWVLEHLQENQEKSVVGSISIVREWSDWCAGYYWWIQSIFIEPQFRGKGLMKIMLDEVKRAAKSEDAVDLRLYVHKDNTRAIKAYQREGFSHTPYRIMWMAL